MIMFVDRDDPEWERMWAALESTAGSRTAANNGEAWMYMGSIHLRGPVVHQFKHRDHPQAGRWVLDVPASPEFSTVAL